MEIPELTFSVSIPGDSIKYWGRTSSISAYPRIVRGSRRFWNKRSEVSWTCISMRSLLVLLPLVHRSHLGWQRASVSKLVILSFQSFCIVGPFPALQMTPLAPYLASWCSRASLWNVLQQSYLDWILLKVTITAVLPYPHLSKRNPWRPFWSHLRGWGSFQQPQPSKVPWPFYTNTNHLSVVLSQGQQVPQYHPRIHEEFS